MLRTLVLAGYGQRKAPAEELQVEMSNQLTEACGLGVMVMPIPMCAMGMAVLIIGLLGNRVAMS